MAGGKLATTITLDQRVGELHDSIERFAVRCSFHARFSENNSCVIAVKPRFHVVILEHIVMHFAAREFVDFILPRAHVGINLSSGMRFRRQDPAIAP